MLIVPVLQPVLVMASFFLAMTAHPEVQKKYQAEIDQVVGNDRLPNLDDRDDLPYLFATLKESDRWGSTTPLGAPHDRAGRCSRQIPHSQGLHCHCERLVSNRFLEVQTRVEYLRPHVGTSCMTRRSTRTLVWYSSQSVLSSNLASLPSFICSLSHLTTGASEVQRVLE